MDTIVTNLLSVWYYAIAGLFLLVIGAVAHVLRAVANPFPDRLSENDRVDMFVSSGYDYKDRLFGTEYDEAGFYRLDSLKNLRNSMMLTLAGGWLLMLITPGLSTQVAQAIDWLWVTVWDLFLYRIANLEWL
ncbi:hypothetical protein [Rhizobium alvei]|uniref:MAPEG family protein n=1 Tax=Rhizobium alvei TaxID=1132659 RepID=A0ABT8YLX3_9HYPH|nr:hypothetical protein [Rhizobium alvei]MDO6964225.1 hypothetical protein [Rhizobium alvei]